jgi:AcrR family transcriptional regulator
MTGPRSAPRGRPPAASREMLQDAAFELFLEQGYAATTVEHVTRRAGVSRNTFFNYFDAKGDVFWVELDEALALLGEGLERLAADTGPLVGLRAVILSLGEKFGPLRVPFALTQHELIGSAHDLQASAVTRLTGAARGIRSFLLSRGLDADTAQAIAYAVVGATVAAAQAWAGAGPTRGTLAPYLDAAIGPVLGGFEQRVG